MARSGAGREEDAASFDMMPPHQGDLACKFQGHKKAGAEVRKRALGEVAQKEASNYMHM